MKFDFAIGNPPYQDDTLGENKTYAPPVYNKFLDAAHEIADKVEMIHPARFLFNAGSTPKAWNEKMLSDPHLKVLMYEKNSSCIFSNTEIKGGIAITYHDTKSNFGEIGTFTAYEPLNHILEKIKAYSGFTSISTIVVSSYAYHFTKELHAQHPEVAQSLSNGHAFDLKSNVFTSIPQVFFDTHPGDGNDYLRILGKIGSDRVFKYIRRDYISTITNTDSFKVFLPAANSNGIFGEKLAPSLVVGPGVCSTETFLSMGSFESEIIATNAEKYTKTKLFRALLGVLKTTQHLTPNNFAYIPLQDFSEKSDINWVLPIPAIDRQLYKKYGLSAAEIDFIEANVKEMA